VSWKKITKYASLFYGYGIRIEESSLDNMDKSYYSKYFGRLGTKEYIFSLEIFDFQVWVVDHIYLKPMGRNCY